MSDVLVCAEPEPREEANQFDSKLGARPQIWSMHALKKRDEKVKGVLVYLKGTEPPATLRSCLRQVSKDSPLHVVVFSRPSSDHQAAELGKIVGELRPRRTYICFDSEEVQKVFHVQMRVVAGEGKQGLNESLAALREELDLTQVDVAAALDVTPRTIQNWESRRKAYGKRFRDLRELHDLLSKYIERDQIATWMGSPNQAFQNRTPRELIREGKTRDLILEFGRLQTGEPL